NQVIVVAVAIKNHRAPSWDLAQTDEIQIVTAQQIRSPFKYVDHRVRRLHVHRIVQGYVGNRTTVNNNLVTHRFGRAGIAIDQQTAALILERPVHEHHAHTYDSRAATSWRTLIVYE